MIKEKTYVKLHSDEDEVLIMKVLTHICVMSRAAEHLMWEMQYAINAARELGIDCDRIEEIKDKIFHMAGNIPLVCQKRFDANVCHRNTEKTRDQDFMIRVAGHDTRGLGEIDEILRNKALMLYEERPLKFDWKNGRLVESKVDCVGEGKLDDWFATYGKDKEDENYVKAKN